MFIATSAKARRPPPGPGGPCRRCDTRGIQEHMALLAVAEGEPLSPESINIALLAVAEGELRFLGLL